MRAPLVVIASTCARPRHPAWYHNLHADPRAWVAVGGTSRAVSARELTGAESDRCFERGVAIHPRFERYRSRAAGRPIPGVRLEPGP